MSQSFAFDASIPSRVRLAASWLPCPSTIVAAKANPPYDAIILDEGPYIAALQHDILEKLPTDKIPNLKDLPKKFIDPRGLGPLAL